MESKSKTSARERVLEAASALFYAQGFNSTTMDQIIERSNVSRPTVYSHFATKEEIGIEYIRATRLQEIEGLKSKIAAASDPEAKALAVIKNVQVRMKQTKFRGCPFFNIVSELVDRDSPMVIEAKKFVEVFSTTIFEQIEYLKKHSKAHKDLDVDAVAKSYYLIASGAMMGCQELGEEWPLDHAVKQVRDLLRE